MSQNKTDTGFSMGELLISDGGKGHSALKSGWVFNLVIAGGILAILLGLGFYLQGTVIRIGNIFNQIRIEPAEIIFVFAVLAPIYPLINAIITHFRISQTEISVYELGVKGTGISPKLAETMSNVSDVRSKDSAPSTFQLTYDQITSVDITQEDKRISINTLAKQYVVYVKNPQAIVDAVNKAKQSQKMEGR